MKGDPGGMGTIRLAGGTIRLVCLKKKNIRLALKDEKSSTFFPFEN